jgi:hypothetical protein
MGLAVVEAMGLMIAGWGGVAEWAAEAEEVAMADEAGLGLAEGEGSAVVEAVEATWCTRRRNLQA